MTLPPYLALHLLAQTRRAQTNAQAWRNTATALSEELHLAITRHPAGKRIPPADPQPAATHNPRNRPTSISDEPHPEEKQ